MKALEVHQMEKIEGGDFLEGCVDGLGFVSGMFVTGVGALSAWQVALIVAGTACVVGGIANSV